jgi:hypothetical protein
MSNFSSKATAPQIETAAQIERETAKLKDLATKTELRFLVYLLEMAHDEAAVIAKGRRDQAESAATLAQNS